MFQLKLTGGQHTHSLLAPPRCLCLAGRPLIAREYGEGQTGKITASKTQHYSSGPHPWSPSSPVSSGTSRPPSPTRSWRFFFLLKTNLRPKSFLLARQLCPNRSRPSLAKGRQCGRPGMCGVKPLECAALRQNEKPQQEPGPPSPARVWKRPNSCYCLVKSILTRDADRRFLALTSLDLDLPGPWQLAARRTSIDFFFFWLYAGYKASIPGLVAKTKTAASRSLIAGLC